MILNGWESTSYRSGCVTVRYEVVEKLKTWMFHDVSVGSGGPQNRQPEAQGWECRPHSSHQQTLKMSLKKTYMETKSITFFCPTQMTQTRKGDGSIKGLHSTFNSNWNSVQFSGLSACVWAFMFWQIYCITSWTAPPVEWREVPVHVHFYIRFLLLYFFNWNILMCFASLILCIKSVLRDLKPCTVMF